MMLCSQYSFVSAINASVSLQGEHITVALPFLEKVSEQK